MDKLRNLIVVASSLSVIGIIVTNSLIKYPLLTISAALFLYVVLENRKRRKSSRHKPSGCCKSEIGSNKRTGRLYLWAFQRAKITAYDTINRHVSTFATATPRIQHFEGNYMSRSRRSTILRYLAIPCAVTALWTWLQPAYLAPWLFGISLFLASGILLLSIVTRHTNTKP